MKLFKRKPKHIAADFRERDPSVLIVVVTKDSAEPECWNSLLKQDYPDFNIMLCSTKARFQHESACMNAQINTARNRNIARRMALATDADFFLLVDSDTVLPPSALSNLMLHQKDFISGWYPCRPTDPYHDTAWPTAFYRGNVSVFFEKPQHSVIMADWTGLGCCLVSRQLYSKLEHKEAMHTSIFVERGDSIQSAGVDDATQFCIDAKKLGYQLYMNGDVVCSHMVRVVSEDTYKLPERKRKSA